ncbi:hypothetical protein MKX03_006369 [Papaver bracteatum]|nr:hypothetical protein MKX03_006369 [Papaver bracteatum]
MFGKGKKNLDFNNYKGLKPTKINNKEGEEEFYGYGYTGKYLNNGEPIDFKNNHGILPNFGTHKPVELQPRDLGYQHYYGDNYPPNYGPPDSDYGTSDPNFKYVPKTEEEWDYGTTDPNFRYRGQAIDTLMRQRADSFIRDIFTPPPPPPPQPPQPPRRGKIPLFFGF